MTQRYFVDSPIATERLDLDGDQARHLGQVMRAAAGQHVVLFDNSGGEFDAEVVRVTRSAVELRVLARRQVDRETRSPIILGVALPKGDRQRWLVEKAVELGVGQLVPLRTTRGVAQPVPAAVQRLRRAVVEASKQCGRNRLMEIADPASVTDFLANCPETAVRWFGHPLGECPTPTTIGERPVYLAVGPEGGWTEDEVAAATQHGWHTVCLGPRILRVETAAVALATLAACR
jgi:16S rRNA (uracil1498-N3)-methyltransferase